jgi:HEPN domain-containing protein
MTAVNLPELWLRYADTDLKSASVLLKEGIYNMVCFHSQQAVEKILKSFMTTFGQEIPRTHNLIRLYKTCEQLHGKTINADVDGLIFLNRVYIDSRYPTDIGLLPSGAAEENDASRAYNCAVEIDRLFRPMIRNQMDTKPDNPLGEQFST